MKLQLSHYLSRLAEICVIYDVKQLSLFGSAARDDFDQDSSDIDFLVDFMDSGPSGAFDRYFGLKETLEQLFQCSVDLVEVQAVKNPYFRQAIVEDRIVVYGTGS
jgi:predicted nucleotidyltransferase